MIQIDMQMPKNCGECPCFHFENPMYCQAVKADKNKKIVAPYGATRPEWCPLKEQEAIIQCKDCKNAEPAFDGKMSRCKIRGLRKNDWFCADGERREGR